MLPHVNWRTGTNISKNRSASNVGLLDHTHACIIAFRNVRNYLPGDTAFILQDPKLQQHRCEKHESREVRIYDKDAYFELNIGSGNRQNNQTKIWELLISWRTDLSLSSWLLIRVFCRYGQNPDRTNWHFTRFHSEPHKTKVKFFSSVPTWAYVGRDSSVGIAALYGLDGPGIESRWRPDFPRPFRQILGPTQPPVQWVLGHSQGYNGRGVALTTDPPHLALRLKNK
jgi:hypothetical protein